MFLSVAPMQHERFASARWYDAPWVHRQVMGLFGDLGGGPGARANGGVLYRIEHAVGDGRVLIQSRVEPVDDGVVTRPLEPLLDALESGRQVRFLLEANPCRTVNHRDEATGVTRHFRAPICPEELPGWIATRIEGAMEITALEVTTQRPRSLEGRGVMAVASFQGYGSVRDPTSLRRHVAEGVGRGKAYGCGLLSVSMC
jgi:CRISPR system Cascade subunit CasE